MSLINNSECCQCIGECGWNQADVYLEWCAWSLMRQRPFCRGWIKMRETGGVTDGRRPMLDVNVIVDNDGSWLSATFLVRSAVTCAQITAIINKKASYHKWSMFSLVQLILGHKLLVIGLSSVLRPRQHSIGYIGDGFYRSKDPTNSIKVLKENLQGKTTKRTKKTQNTCVFVYKYSIQV